MHGTNVKIIYFKLEVCDVRLRVVDNIYILFGEGMDVLSPVVTIRSNSRNVKNFTLLPHSLFICLEWISYYFLIPRSLIGFYIGEELCLLRGTN